jgi:hypothetical protein
MLSGILILTAYEGTEINPGSRTYREYNSFLFLKKGKRKKYGSIEKIFVNSGKVTQKVYTAHTMTSATFSRVEYNAWLKFRDGEKLFLASARNKEKLLKRLNEIAGKLNTSVVDSTT